MSGQAELLLRIVVATVLGATIGLEREAETEYESRPGELTVTLDVQVRADVAAATLLRTLGDQPGVAHVRIGAPG